MARALDRGLLLDDSGAMMKLCIFAGTTIGGYVGWFLGDRFGFGVAFVLSSVGSLVGVYAGWKLGMHFNR